MFGSDTSDMRSSIEGFIDLLLWRDGGQRGARRNAWAAMVVDNARARARTDAEQALHALGSLPAPSLSADHAHMAVAGPR